MKWFKHFSSAHDGNSLTKVRMKFGAEGYAVYWYCLELIAGDLGENGNATFELKHDAEVIAYSLKMDTLRVEEIMRYMISLGMFGEHNSTITCLKLAKYLDKNFTRNKQIQDVIDAYKESQTVSDSLKTNPDSLRLSQGDEMRLDETREEQESNPNGLLVDGSADRPAECPHQQIIKLYHEILPMCPPVQQWTDARKAKLRQRWREDAERQNLDWWCRFFTYVAKSAFLTGRTDGGKGRNKPFLASLEWLVTPSKFVKVIEGNYHDG